MPWYLYIREEDEEGKRTGNLYHFKVPLVGDIHPSQVKQAIEDFRNLYNLPPGHTMLLQGIYVTKNQGEEVVENVPEHPGTVEIGGEGDTQEEDMWP